MDLKMAAQEGEINALYELIRRDRKLLDRVDEIPFEDTPLHIAAAAGKTLFAIEIMRLKPSFCRKLNPDGLTPLHLALINNQMDTVKRMIKLDRELIRVPGREGITPLHFVAARADTVDIMAKFLLACPESVKDVTGRRETVVHVAVRNGRLETLKVLLGWLKRTSRTEFLNWKDGKGDTVLHVAVSTNQPQMLKLLISEVRREAKNADGLTALDIALKIQDARQIDNTEVLILLNILWPEYANYKIKPIIRPKFVTLTDFLSSEENRLERVIRYLVYLRRDLSIDKRNLILVVAVLIVTTTYQAIIQPPGGVWPADNNQNNNNDVNINYVTPHGGKVVMPPYLFGSFLVANTVAFTASLGVILFVLSLSTYSFLLHISLFFLMWSYVTAVKVIAESKTYTAVVFVGVWCLLSAFNVRIDFYLFEMSVSIVELKWLKGTRNSIAFQNAVLDYYQRNFPGAMRFSHRLRKQYRIVLQG